ncbi:hypothetical protein G6162_003530 [Salmonella enterica]|uniref:Cell division protein DrpB n=4 Tax=Salmonella enterica TaxID=28901 RepID=A0A3J6UPE9_SALER|nr:hypothetical protein [Salmonella enterica]EAN8610568.1 hypothetical protein [Salmonella enterica subsp. arizonae serovar 48:z4,z24:-]EAO5937790.1 hypothetical protein [Salmonella enterica subsp. houtenae serovar 48:g,z51:-]EAT8891822.1 hypothetical protein [Salmonella enterica subsp. arizonae serovar 53:z4,z23,z32:-]EAW3052085.1 hypothetical protein [Salmonella enterica subsp. enterica]EBD1260172.1 hypothetical protein [Salmonella enterica subsp. arizonae serovar 62:z4,z32:-]EBH9978196.1 h
MSTREEKATRSMGGKLALWVFYTFCVYFIWVMARYVWLISVIQVEPVLGPNGAPVSVTEKWLNALSLGVVLLILGSIAWYTRPRKGLTFPSDTKPEMRNQAGM